jgi:drug/metabolite transporter (DMT)-like permease
MMFGAPAPTEDNETPLRLGLIAAVLCFCFFLIAGFLSISESKSSTAAIGYIFLPFYAAIISAFAFLAGWCVGRFLVWYRSPAKTVILK